MSVVFVLRTLDVGHALSPVLLWIYKLRGKGNAFVIVGVATVVWSYAFARPGRRARELERAGLQPATVEMWLRATALTALVLIAILALSRGAVQLFPDLPGLFRDPAMRPPSSRHSPT